MRDTVIAVFPRFTEALEGSTPYLYQDVLGLVTTGRGNLVDPIQTAYPLPWKIAGVTAARGDIWRQWQAVKVMSAGMLAAEYASATTMRLAPEDIDALTLSRLMNNAETLCDRFSGFEDMPANAQLGLSSMAWAMGPRFSFPKFEDAVQAGDWGAAAVECHMNDVGNAGLVPRNKINVQLFLAAGEPGDPDTIRGWQASG